MRPLKLLVLDTNVVLDWLVFRDPSVDPLARAIESQGVRLITCVACVAELERVLAYPEFKLDAPAQSTALGVYARHAELLEEEACAPSQLPRCSDPDDQMFLELAWRAGADFLVTRDKALLGMARRIAGFGRFAIVRAGDLPLAE